MSTETAAEVEEEKEFRHSHEEEEHEEEEREEKTETTKPEETDEIRNAFKKFRESKSEHTFTSSAKEMEEEDDGLSIEERFKLNMFVGLFFMLLNGAHAFIYSFFAKQKITAEEIGLDEDDQEEIADYFKTRKVIEMINKLPTELLGFIHMEYLYFQKFQELQEKRAEEEVKEEMAAKKKKREGEEEKKTRRPKKKKRPAVKKETTVTT